MLFWFGVFLMAAGITYAIVVAVSDNASGVTPAIIMIANGVFFFFLRFMFGAAPAMEYMREHRDTAVDRVLESAEAPKEELATEPPPEGVHIPGPSYWPPLLALGAALTGAGLIFDVAVNVFLAAGVVVLVFTGAGWAVQAWKERAEIVAHEQHEHANH